MTNLLLALCHLSASGLGFSTTDNSSQPGSNPGHHHCCSHCLQCYFHTILAV